MVKHNHTFNSKELVVVPDHPIGEHNFDDIDSFAEAADKQDYPDKIYVTEAALEKYKKLITPPKEDEK